MVPVSSAKVRDPRGRESGRRLVTEGRVPNHSSVAPSPLRATRYGKMYRRLRRAGVRKPLLVMRKSRHFDLPVALVVAMLEQETGIPQRNIFGCDWGPQGGRPPYCGDDVTNSRVRAMQASGKPNGVGWTQLTWPSYVRRAMARRGGAAKPRNQLHVGVSVLAANVRTAGSFWGGLRLYNGSSAYADEVIWRFNNWHKRLTR